MSLWTMTDNEAGKPKYLSDELRNEQTVSDKDATVGIDAAEKVNVTSAQHAGWVTVRTYTDQHGNTRTKSETLVAGGSMTGDNDDIAPEITITVAPTDVSVVAPATATFSVTATKTGAGTLTYQWQKAESSDLTTYVNIAGATSASYTTGATAVAAGSGATNGDKYRVVVSLAGAQSVASDAVTLTVTAE